MFSPVVPAFLLFSIVRADNFTFSYSTPKACDQLTISWNGGQPPYSLLITPTFSIPVNISIPSDATNSFSTSLPINDTSSFVLTMSDKSGFGTGGTSPLLTPTSSGNNTCQNATHPAFTFSLPSALQQCGPFTFNNYNGASFPLQFIGIIPQGTAFSLVTNDHNSFSWNADVKAGTQIIWVAKDAKGRYGGSSDILSVQRSSSSSCINSNSPSSTASPTPQSDGDHTSAILGGAIGGSLAALLIIGGVLFVWLKKRRQRDAQLHTTAAYSEPEPGPGPEEGLALRGPLTGSSSRSSRMRERHHVRPMPETYDDHPSPPAHGPSDPSLEPYPFTFAAPETEPSESRTRRSSKAGLLTTPRTTRFILHTDAEDEGDEEEVVELPPQYKPSRGPAPPLQSEHPNSPTSSRASTTPHHDLASGEGRNPVHFPSEPGPSYTGGTAI